MTGLDNLEHRTLEFGGASASGDSMSTRIAVSRFVFRESGWPTLGAICRGRHDAGRFGSLDRLAD